MIPVTWSQQRWSPVTLVLFPASALRLWSGVRAFYLIRGVVAVLCPGLFPSSSVLSRAHSPHTRPLGELATVGARSSDSTRGGCSHPVLWGCLPAGQSWVAADIHGCGCHPGLGARCLLVVSRLPYAREVSCETRFSPRGGPRCPLLPGTRQPTSRCPRVLCQLPASRLRGSENCLNFVDSESQAPSEPGGVGSFVH